MSSFKSPVTVPWVSNSNSQEVYEKFFKRAMNDEYQMFSTHVPYGDSVPLDVYTNIQTGGAKHADDPVMVSPVEAALNIAKSEMRRDSAQDLSSLQSPVKTIKRKQPRKKSQCASSSRKGKKCQTGSRSKKGKKGKKSSTKPTTARKTVNKKTKTALEQSI